MKTKVFFIQVEHCRGQGDDYIVQARCIEHASTQKQKLRCCNVSIFFCFVVVEMEFVFFKLAYLIGLALEINSYAESMVMHMCQRRYPLLALSL